MATHRGIRFDDRLAGRRVLVVDDDLYLVQLLVSILRRVRATPSIALDAATASDRLAEHPDLLILDLILPDRCGLDLLEDLRERNDPPFARTIVHTAFNATIDATPAWRARAAQTLESRTVPRHPRRATRRTHAHAGLAQGVGGPVPHAAAVHRESTSVARGTRVISNDSRHQRFS